MNTILCSSVGPEHKDLANIPLPFWFNSAWMHSIAELHNAEPRILICYKNDNPAAFLPLYEKKLFTLKKAYNPTLVYYSPLIFYLPSRKLKNRELLLEYDLCKTMGGYLMANYRKILLNLNPEIVDIRGFRDSGLKTQLQYTFIVNLNEQIEFFGSEAKKLRAVSKEGYAFTQKPEPAVFADLLFEMYHRKKHPFAIEQTSLIKLIHNLQTLGLAKQYNVEKDAKIVSSILVIEDGKDVAYGWLTASEPTEMSKGASLYLFQELFRILAAKYKYLDLCGANSKGPSRLKAALGAELKMFLQIYK